MATHATDTGQMPSTEWPSCPESFVLASPSTPRSVPRIFLVDHAGKRAGKGTEAAVLMHPVADFVDTLRSMSICRGRIGRSAAATRDQLAPDDELAHVGATPRPRRPGRSSSLSTRPAPRGQSHRGHSKSVRFSFVRRCSLAARGEGAVDDVRLT
jgi:hypothetical protein